MRELIIGKNEANQRLDKLLHKYLKAAGNSFLYKMLRKKNITLNDKRCEGNEILAEGDVVKLWLSEDTIEKFMGAENADGAKKALQTGISQKSSANSRSRNADSDLRIPVVYEDADIIIYNKPAGLLSQKSVPQDFSVNDILLAQFPPTETFTPSICNRLDRNTSGLIIGGKTLKGLQETAELLRERAAHKDYLAVVEGVLKEGAEIHTQCDGKELHSEVKPIAAAGDRSYVFVRLYTGKTHQIRIHMKEIGHPIVGDRRYGSGRGAGRQLLHAYRLTFPDGRVVEAPIPEDFQWELGKPEAFEDLPWRI